MAETFHRTTFDAEGSKHVDTVPNQRKGPPDLEKAGLRVALETMQGHGYRRIDEGRRPETYSLRATDRGETQATILGHSSEIAASTASILEKQALRSSTIELEPADYPLTPESMLKFELSPDLYIFDMPFPKGLLDISFATMEAYFSKVTHLRTTVLNLQMSGRSSITDEEMFHLRDDHENSRSRKEAEGTIPRLKIEGEGLRDFADFTPPSIRSALRLAFRDQYFARVLAKAGNDEEKAARLAGMDIDTFRYYRTHDELL